MKLGLSIGYSRAHLDIPVKLVQRAEELGYDSVWTAEAYGSDAVTPLAYLAALTKRIKLGTGIMQLAARTPANAAMSAATVDAMAGGGRFIAGLGVSGPQIVEGWYGQPWGKPYWRMRDYVTIMRKIFRREAPVTHDGKEIALPYTGPGAMGIGKPLKSILHMNPDIPIYLATGNESTVKLTAEIADGWLPMGFMPGAMDEYRPWLEEGFRRAGNGKSMRDFSIIASVHVEVDDDVKASLAKLKPAFKKEGGSVTAGNASGINDGAAFFVLADAAVAASAGHKPMARLVSYAIAGVPNEIMGEGPIPATKLALKKAGLTLDQMDVIEANEAFAAQAIAVARGLELDMSKTNVNGGAIALGHPIGCSGAFIATKLVYELHRSGGRYGLATMCIGGGQGIAVIFERL